MQIAMVMRRPSTDNKCLGNFLFQKIKIKGKINALLEKTKEQNTFKMFGYFFLYTAWGFYNLTLYFIAWCFSCLAKPFFSSKTKEEDEKWIRDWLEACNNRDRILQRELYLLDELEQLDKKEDTLFDDEKALCKRKDALQNDLDKMGRNLWEYKQTCAKLVREIKHRGPWATAHFCTDAFIPHALLREAYYDCLLKGGCCARGCGCCWRYRGSNYEKASDCWDVAQNRWKFSSHCTAQCRCCIKYRGFNPDDKEDGYQTK